MSLRRVVFLDIDGVIAHSEHVGSRRQNQDKPKHIKDASVFDPDCIDILNFILEAAGSEIVLCSQWRIGWSIEEMNKIFSYLGVSRKIVDFTPSNRGERELEIGLWLDQNPVEDFLIIDDEYHSKFKDNLLYIPNGWSNKGLKGLLT